MSITVGTDSYITVADADLYFLTRLESTDWTDASAGDKEIALKQATRTLDQMFNWAGTILVSTQALGWLRQGVYNCEEILLDEDEIPTEIENATCEMAIYLLGGNTAELPALLSKGFKRAKVGPIEVEADLAFTPQTIPDKVVQAVACVGSLKSTGERTFR